VLGKPGPSLLLSSGLGLPIARGPDATAAPDGAVVPAALAQELADALLDTIELIGHPGASAEIAIHVDYLRRLRRVAERALAVAS
jgi:hypothetical protein